MQLGIRLQPEDVERIKRLSPIYPDQYTRPTLTELVRMSLLEGVNALEAKHPELAKGSKPPPKKKAAKKK